MDTTFRDRQQTSDVKTEEKPIKQGASPVETTVEPPYLDYEHEKGKPYLVDYFDLGEYWQDKVGGFESEVQTINNYIKDEIEQGRLENSVEAVKNLLKKIEKQAGYDKTDRNVVKIAQMAAFTEFLYKTRDIKTNNQKYGAKY